MKKATSKVEQWQQFSKLMEDHIRNYGVAQYGDFPDPQVEGFTPEKLQSKLEHYVNRIGRGVRGPEEAKRDAKKMAHIACYLFAILEHGNAAADLLQIAPTAMGQAEDVVEKE